MKSSEQVQSTCTLRVSGGLGNQLFQYAAGRSLALRTNSRLLLDLSFYDQGRHRAFELKHFSIQAETSPCDATGSTFQRCMNLMRSAFSRNAVYRERHFQFDPKFALIQPPIILEGYFQSHRYFSGIEQIIRQELKVPEPEDTESIRLARQMADVQSTVLHIRRGDYVSSAKASRIYAECSLLYYQQAMESIPGKDPVFVLSDDLNWARTHLPAVKPLVFPDQSTPRSAIADLWLMTQAYHHIIANSSFSWWGAWLANESGGRKIAPRNWFNDAMINDRDLIPETWSRL